MRICAHARKVLDNHLIFTVYFAYLRGSVHMREKQPDKVVGRLEGREDFLYNCLMKSDAQDSILMN